MTLRTTQYRHIRDLREDADLTQGCIAKMIGCSQVAYSYYEIGNRDIPTDILIKLANFYNVSIDYLLDQTNNKKRSI